MLRALPLAVLPVVFALGFWMRGVVAPAGRGTATEVGKQAAPTVAVQNPPAKKPQRKPAVRREEKPAAVAVQVVDNVAPRPEEEAAAEPQLMPRIMAPPEMARRKPSAATIGPGRNGLESWGVRPAGDNLADPADGFSLNTSGQVRHVSAEVIRPVRAWFATATKEADCATGTCPAPVARLDRKLNTALEWSASPAAAAAQAEREGKLVFLIHVSGNFAQPGFT